MQKNHYITRILGANIAQRRKKQGLSQASLAELLGIGTDSLSRIEKGGIAPRFERLDAIATALCCDVAELFRQPDDSARTRAQRLATMMEALPNDEQEQLLTIMEGILRFKGVGK